MNRRRLGYAIALAALLISIPRYIATLNGIDPVAITAYGMGILLAGGAAYIFDAWADASKREVKHTGRLWLALGLNLVYEPILLTPFILSRLWGETLASVMSPGYAVFWAIAVTVAPILLVGGIVYAIHFQKETRTRQSVEEKPQKSAKETATRKAIKADWLDILDRNNGNLVKCDSAKVKELLSEMGLQFPSARTMDLWAELAREKTNEQ